MLDQLGNGLWLGAIVALTSVGLSLIFGVTGVFNFAHGDLVTFGAVFAFTVSTAGHGLPVWLSVVLAALAGVIFGALLELGLFRPLRHRGVGSIAMLVLTLGLSLIIQYALLIWVGPSPHQMPLPNEHVHAYGPITLVPVEALSVVISVAVLVVLGLFLKYTDAGATMRAVSDNPDLAAASGVSVSATSLGTWMLGVGLASFGGALAGLGEAISWDMGADLLLLMFAGVILGGLGTAFGAIVGGFVVGLAAQLSVGLPVIGSHTDLKYAVALLVMVVVLLIRPSGLLSWKVRIS